MTSEPVSFRISRTAEDLAQTVAALSRRLVSLEQAIEAMDLQLQRQHDLHPQELASLERVDQLLLDCRELLEPAAAAAESEASQQGDSRTPPLFQQDLAA